MVRWAGASALAVAAFIAFLATGSGRAAEHGEVAKDGAATKEAAAPPTKETAKSAAPAAGAADTAKTDKAEKAGEKSDAAAKGATAEKPAEGAAPAKRSRSKRKHDAADGEPQLPPGQGPPPPSPLTVNGLHQELNRDRSPGGEFDAPPRVKLEQLLAQVGKARQSLHDDTLKLEAMAGSEQGKEGESAGTNAPGPAPGGPGQPAQKNPLDVLAKALRGIKPEQAGPIVARLEKGLAATVLLKMPPVDAGKIMGALKPEVAAELATQIAMRAPAPQLGGRR